jgi:hypothetical protein
MTIVIAPVLLEPLEQCEAKLNVLAADERTTLDPNDVASRLLAAQTELELVQALVARI